MGPAARLDGLILTLYALRKRALHPVDMSSNKIPAMAREGILAKMRDSEQYIENVEFDLSRDDQSGHLRVQAHSKTSGKRLDKIMVGPMRLHPWSNCTQSGNIGNGCVKSNGRPRYPEGKPEYSLDITELSKGRIVVKGRMDPEDKDAQMQQAILNGLFEQVQEFVAENARDFRGRNSGFDALAKKEADKETLVEYLKTIKHNSPPVREAGAEKEELGFQAGTSMFMRNRAGEDPNPVPPCFKEAAKEDDGILKDSDGNVLTYHEVQVTDAFGRIIPDDLVLEMTRARKQPECYVMVQLSYFIRFDRKNTPKPRFYLAGGPSIVLFSTEEEIRKAISGDSGPAQPFLALPPEAAAKRPRSPEEEAPLSAKRPKAPSDESESETESVEELPLA